MHIPSRLSLNVFAATTAMFVISISVSVLPGAEFFVAPHGNDANPGTKEQPLATLQRARDAIRELKKAGPLPVFGVRPCFLFSERFAIQVYEDLFPVVSSWPCPGRHGG